ncbi:MAG TPA: BlaI/MecI/CopY family transcriptional regulator, partial [Planctomycetota bacterium]|nr:BlaI/MecI/CopY family transcriptional regulator [Planctomycetota bacterium]
VWQGADERHGGPCSARDVLERVHADTGWAYTTVKTLLARLVGKGVLAVRLRANTSLYVPLVPRHAAQKSAVRLLLQKAFDGTFGALLHHLVTAERLSAKDRRRLRQLLADAAHKERR